MVAGGNGSRWFKLQVVMVAGGGGGGAAQA
jgi:hypothetical protein